MRQRKPQRLPHHLSRGRSPQKLAAASRCGASPAAEHLKVVNVHLAPRQPRTRRLDLARVLAFFRRQGHPAGHDNNRQVWRTR